MGLDQFFASVKHASKIQYDLQGIVRLLVYGRILEPASKCATMGQNEKYFAKLVSSGNPDNVYDALTVIDENAEKLFRRINMHKARHRAQPFHGVLRRDELLLRNRRCRR